MKSFDACRRGHFSARLQSVAWLVLAAGALLGPMVIPGLYGSIPMVSVLAGSFALTACLGTLVLAVPRARDADSSLPSQ